ncbi:MAG: hypothetical protein EOP83_24430, partial [Verrucomicrobiaceae bacterium]
MLSEAFTSVLRSGRAEFNALFVQARRHYPELDGNEFGEFLRQAVEPLVCAVETCAPERIEEVVSAAYEVGLELVGQRIAGPGARRREFEEGWRVLMPGCAFPIAAAPRRLLGALSNGLHTLASTPGARITDWTAEMVRLAPRVEQPEILLGLGKVLAWKAGLAHFREGSLAAADLLPEELALEALGASSGSAWTEVRARLAADPWYVPGLEEGGMPMPRVGAFSGFGGLFPEPPRVAAAGEDLLVLSGDTCWLLTADAFGATFHRTTLDIWRGGGTLDLPLPKEVRL